MKRRFKATGVIALILALVIVPLSLAADYAQREVLHVWLTTDKDTYKVGEEIDITLTVTNKSKTDRAKVTYLTAVVNLPDRVTADEEKTYAYSDVIRQEQTKELSIAAKSVWNKPKPAPMSEQKASLVKWIELAKGLHGPLDLHKSHTLIVDGKEITIDITKGGIRWLTVDKEITVGGKKVTVSADIAFVYKWSYYKPVAAPAPQWEPQGVFICPHGNWILNDDGCKCGICIVFIRDTHEFNGGDKCILCGYE